MTDPVENSSESDSFPAKELGRDRWRIVITGDGWHPNCIPQDDGWLIKCSPGTGLEITYLHPGEPY